MPVNKCLVFPSLGDDSAVNGPERLLQLGVLPLLRPLGTYYILTEDFRLYIFNG